jgi:predicted hotdog family 3-hydroxylacyl-ACP dehydratase
MTLADKAAIAKAIPHAGNMCLLDGVLECDKQRIRCISQSHRDSGNPMRSGNQLSALCGVEYAAQAMAVHGVMGGQLDSTPRAGFLVSLRDVKCSTMRLDTLQDDLVIDAEKLMGDEARVIYQFVLSAGKDEILSGRATVVLDADKVSA